MIKLSDRLSKICEYVIEGQPLADIGSDHALLPCFLVADGVCSSAICGELTDGPFNRAKQAVLENKLSELIDVRKGSGLDVLKEGEVSTVVIAGMGGNTIVEVLESASHVETFSRLILQPAGALAEVRDLIARRGWVIEDEAVVRERGFFVIIVVCPCPGEGYYLSDLEKEFGPVLLRQFQKEDVKDYLAYETNKLNRIIQQIRDHGGEEARSVGEKYDILKNQLEGILYDH